MFETVELGKKVGKSEYNERLEAVRPELLRVQRELENTNCPVIVIVAGVDASGKGSVVNRLNEWFDTRGIETRVFWDETDEERERPRYWRFWRALPPRGKIGVHFGGWYQYPLNECYTRNITDISFDLEMDRIRRYEQMLARDNALIIKLWYHLPEKEQKHRLEELKRDDRSRWKMTPKLSKHSAHYHAYTQTAERMIRLTDTGSVPWTMIEATDTRHRDLTTAEHMLQVIQSRLDRMKQSSAGNVDNEDTALHVNRETLLDHVDLSRTLEKTTYRKQLSKLQEQINELIWEAYNRKLSTVLVFEGADAAGKGGSIRRITNAIDARLYRAISVAAPTDEERAHHYLWRFWRAIPRAGYTSIYDRSWYGRVLVERVEGFATDHEWRRSYNEINEFEEQLAESNTLVLKFWFQIDQDEQLKRFKLREQTPRKQHKITDEDWRNREKWDEYESAINEMIARTSTSYAPWHIIPGNDKKFARVETLKILKNALKSALKAHEKLHEKD